MKFVDTAIPEVKIIEPKVHGDSRGYFMETFRENLFQEACGPIHFVQENQSSSRKDVLRGIHYQIKKPQGKLVRVTKGCVFDVAVDLRKSSATFAKWVGVELSDKNKRQLWVPEGFGHGFLVLSEEAEFSYKCTNYYAPEYDRSILWSDEQLCIEWPTSSSPTLSEKDCNASALATAELFE